jgi:HK97 family phage major capsid protein
MPNAVLESLREQRAEQIATMDAVLSEVEGRDLVDAERSLLDRARDRIGELDAQIEPLASFEELRAQHDATTATLPAPRTSPRPIAGDDRANPYASAGAFVVDYLRAGGIIERGRQDPDAAQRVAMVQQRADQTTTNTPGILPTPIVGQVVDLIDARRPLISSLGGAKAMGGIPGKTFTRPKITQHVTVGVQSAEKTALPSQNMVIGSVTFTKATYGGTVDISRQDIDWTDPSAWDILIRDLANVYAIQTETAVAADFVAKATGTKPPALPATPVLADWSHALYTAGMHSYQAGQRMPAVIWCSLDVWAALGSLVDTARLVLPQNKTDEMGAAGTSTLADFRGDLLGLPRVVVPTFPAKTCIVGPSDLYESYEEVIGLLSVIEPSILGVQVAYGGYVAFGALAGPAYVALDLSAVTNLPTSLDADELAAAQAQEDEANEAAATSSRKATK